MNLNSFNPLDDYNRRQPNMQSALEAELSLSGYVAKIMQKVYTRMFLGILVTALTALAVISSPALLNFFFGNSVMMWVLLIAEIGLVLFLSARLNKLKATTAAVLFFLFATLNGITLTPICFAYTGVSIAKTFFITAGVFGAMSVYGYVTKRDLSKLGSILFMCLIGLIIVSVVNIFLASSTLDWVISFAGVAIFIGLTAWDTQNIKQMAAETDYTNVSKLATIGALELYLDFINLFLYLLRFFGSRE